MFLYHYLLLFYKNQLKLILK